MGRQVRVMVSPVLLALALLLLALHRGVLLLLPHLLERRDPVRDRTLDVLEVVHDPPVVDVGHLSQPDESFIGVELHEDVT